MSVNSIRIDDDVKKETVRIADKLGLSFNSVVDISLRMFNRNKGFSEPVRIYDENEASYMEMTPSEIERKIQRLVRNRNRREENSALFVTMMDEKGRLYRQFDDGRVEYVLR